MKQTEHNLQVACLKWFKLQYPQYKDLIWATPNAGKRSGRAGKYMVAEGMKKGVPDIFIAVPYFINEEMVCGGLFVELKVKPNKLTQEQKKMIEVLDGGGYRAKVCYSFDEFVGIIKNYFCGM